MYRSTGDIQDNWNSIKSIAISQIDKAPFTGNFCHNDMDMLVVGMFGGSNNDFIGKIGGCTVNEYKTHFALWSIMGSPLMIGCDIRNTNDDIKRILMNKGLIEINQDPEARGCYMVTPQPQWFQTNEAFILVKVLADGDLAIGLFNLTDDKREMSLQFWDLGIATSSGKKLQLYDVWEEKDLGVFSERFHPTIDAHDCVVVRAKIV